MNTHPKYLGTKRKKYLLKVLQGLDKKPCLKHRRRQKKILQTQTGKEKSS